MNIIPKRALIYSLDIINITGKSATTARRIIQRIKKQNNKPDAPFVTVAEFCAYMKLNEDDIRKFLK